MLIFIIGSIICGLAFNCINAFLVTQTELYMDECGYYSRFFLCFSDFCEYTTITTFLIAVIIAAIPIVNIIAIIIVGIVWLFDGDHQGLSWRPFKWLNK